jgi:hypothetical protein
MSGKPIVFKRKLSKAEQRAENDAKLTTEQVEYRDRARNERKRFVNATDTEFWLCLCFPSESDLAKWRTSFGFGSLHELVKYETVSGSFKQSGSAARFGFGAGVSFGGLGFEKTADPLANVTYVNDLEQDCLAEFAALHEAFVSAKAPRKLADVTDSDIWFALVFKDRDTKDGFLASHGLTKIGDKYLDGIAVLKQLS